jgi:hypothetical protein
MSMYKKVSDRSKGFEESPPGPPLVSMDDWSQCALAHDLLPLRHSFKHTETETNGNYPDINTVKDKYESCSTTLTEPWVSATRNKLVVRISRIYLGILKRGERTTLK